MKKKKEVRNKDSKNENPKWVEKSRIDLPTLLLHPKFGHTNIDQESNFI